MLAPSSLSILDGGGTKRINTNHMRLVRKMFSNELVSVKKLEFESNSLPFVFGCVIRNWNLNVIPPPTTTYRCFPVGLFGFRFAWVGLIIFDILKLYPVTELNTVWVSGRTKPRFFFCP